MKKAIIVEDCVQCPKWLKCTPSKKLSSKQRFIILTGVGLNKVILKGCPLPDLKDEVS